MIQPRSTRSTRFFADQLKNRFQNLLGGRVKVTDQDGNFDLTGQLDDRNQYDDDLLAAHVLVGDAEMYRRVITGGTIGAAESYMAGQWSTDNLTNLIRIMIRNLDHFSRLEKTWARLKNLWHFVSTQLAA